MWTTIAYSILIPIMLLLNSFLSFVTLLYSNVDLFKIDLVETSKKDRKLMSKFSLILKNNYLLFVSICILQNIIGFFLSRFLGEVLPNGGTKFELLLLLLLSFFIMCFTEIIPNYFVSKEYAKALTLNEMLLNFAYLITLIFSPLKLLIKERKKFFTHSEKDLIRFINNLSSKEILLIEPHEAQLVKLAFNLDDDDVRSVLIPIKNSVCLNTLMSVDEIKKIYLDKNLTKYPVFDESGSLIGILNIKSLVFSTLNDDPSTIKDWRHYINRKIIFFEKETKLNNALEILRNSRSHISIVKGGKKILGIVTLKDILGALVGKIYDEKLTVQNH